MFRINLQGELLDTTFATQNKYSDLYRWQAESLSRVTFNVPDNWKAGRIWVCETFSVRQLPADRNSFNLRRVVVNATSAQNRNLLHV